MQGKIANHEFDYQSVADFCGEDLIICLQGMHSNARFSAQNRPTHYCGNIVHNFLTCDCEPFFGRLETVDLVKYF